jgi:hypothetical protein
VNILSEAEEEEFEILASRIAKRVAQRGILVKPFFDDAHMNKNSPALVGHVTEKQFRQVVHVDLELKNVSESEMDLLINKFRHNELKEMINYMAFAATVDAPESAFDPYSLR